jgi:hypothetical protein
VLRISLPLSLGLFALIVVACGGSDSATQIGQDADGGVSSLADAGAVSSKDGGGTSPGVDAGSSKGTDAGSASDAGATVTAAALLALTKTCKTKISTSPYATDVGSPDTVDVCGLKGAVFFSADMDIDCDGKSTATCSKATDPSFQGDTAAQASVGGPLDAAVLPYVVVPIASTKWSYTTSGLALGSVVAVIYNGKLEFGVIGDLGPKTIIGEASYAMAKSLGIPSSPSTGGVDSGVTYIAFTGKSAMVKKNEDHAEAVQVGLSAAQAVLSSN